MKTAIGKSSNVRLFLTLTSFVVTFYFCRCDPEDDKENPAQKTAKNIVKDSLVKRN